MTMKAQPSSSAEVIPASFIVEEYTDAENLVRYGSFQQWLTGSQPFMVEDRIERSLAANDVLPDDLVLVRVVTGKSVVALIAVADGVTVGMEVGLRYTEFRVSAVSQAAAERVAAQINERAEVLTDHNRVPVRIWRYERDGSYDDRLLSSPEWSNIENNYPEKVRQQLGELMALPALEQSSARLILWSGEPGTGKTTALRALTRAWLPWCAVQYMSDPERLFNEPAYLNAVLETDARDPRGPRLDAASRPDTTWRLIVAEDSDEFLRSDARSKAGVALGRVLNLTDGILGQQQNVLVLLTTNEGMSRLHPALIRPGRCLSNIEFERFTIAQARRWLNGTAKVARPSTLAELLAARGDIGAGSDEGESLPIGAYL